MGTYVDGVYLPALAEVGWDEEVNDALLQLSHIAVDVTSAPYGADRLGVADSTAAIQDAIDAVGMGVVFLPAGIYKVSATLVIGATGTTTSGVRLVGAGVGTTRLQPTSGFASTPVIKIINGRNCSVEHMGIRGNASVDVRAAIELNVNDPGAAAPSDNLFANLALGSIVEGDALNIMQDGIRVTSHASYDQNNDFNEFRHIRMSGLSGIAYSFEHKNTLCNTIKGGQITQCDKGVSVQGGSFALYGTGLNEIGTTEFEFLAPANGLAYTHASVVDGCQSEYSLGGGAAILTTTDDDFINVNFNGYERVGSQATLTVVSYNAPGKLMFLGCNIRLGQSAQTFEATDPASNVVFIGCALQFSTIAYAGRLALLGTTHYAAYTLTGTSLAKLEIVGDFDEGGAGTETPNNISRIDGTKIALQVGGPSAANPKWRIDAAGKMSWGAGAASAVDTNLYRLSAGVLATDHAFYIAHASGGDVTFLSRVTGDSVGRFYCTADGTLLFSDGSGAPDVQLARSAANVLALAAGDSLRHVGSAHGSLPAASGFAAGSQYYCTSDKQPLWSDGSSWYEADGTTH